MAYQTTTGPKLAFANSTLLRMSRSGLKPATEIAASAALYQDENGRQVCFAECRACFGNFTDRTQVPVPCLECEQCLTLRKAHHFLAQIFVGCNDVDGVNENGVVRGHEDRCYDTQTQPMARPTAPPGAL
uniref:Uncharacterized protein n=1 Tax=Eutreptiella gymnastica TaxID=73025 RepID=A0A7S1NTH3_9EUGL